MSKARKKKRERLDPFLQEYINRKRPRKKRQTWNQ